MCPDQDIVEAEEVGLEKASCLVSLLLPLRSPKTPQFSLQIDIQINGGAAFIATSERQISRDLVEEWVVAGICLLQHGSDVGRVLHNGNY